MTATLVLDKDNCYCFIHIGFVPDKPCLGHGKNCECTIFLERKQSESVERKEKAGNSGK